MEASSGLELRRKECIVVTSAEAVSPGLSSRIYSIEYVETLSANLFHNAPLLHTRFAGIQG